MTVTASRPPALSISASLRLPLIEKWLRRIDPESVLEVGCGMGAMGYRLATRYDYRAYEQDHVSFEIAAERLVALGAGEVHNVPIPRTPDRPFDVVVAFEVLEHIEDDVAALRDWTMWLAPRGHVLLSVPAHPDRFGSWDRKVGHYRRYSRETLAQAFGDAGLDVLSIESWGMPVGYLLEAGRNMLAAMRLREMEVGTSGSGRIYQPPEGLGRAVERIMRPLVYLQDQFKQTDRGIGYVVVGRRLGSPPPQQ